MDDIKNVGKKGYCFLYFFIFLFGLIALLVYVYRQNFQLDF
mgnify:CR=1 FL=1